jgi:hypothetical protein
VIFVALPPLAFSCILSWHIVGPHHSTLCILMSIYVIWIHTSPVSRTHGHLGSTFFGKIQNHAMHSAGYDSDGGEWRQSLPSSVAWQSHHKSSWVVSVRPYVAVDCSLCRGLGQRNARECEAPNGSYSPTENARERYWNRFGAWSTQQVPTESFLGESNFLRFWT